MMKKQHLFLAILVYIMAIFYLAITTPITPHEAKVFYTSDNIVSTLMHWGFDAIGGFLGLRIIFIYIGFLSIALFYEISRRYFPRRDDAYLATTIFMFLPGILTALTLANVAILVLPLILYFVLMYERKSYWSLPLVMLALFFIHESSIIFFVALLLYGITHKDKNLAILSSAFLVAFIYLVKGIDISGRPSGHFVEIFGLYATVFSPLVFLYFFYALYRILLREKKTLLWYISFTALAFSLLISIRQRVAITDFAPYVMIAIILMLDVFNKSLRVRLPEFRKRYLLGFYSILFFLSISVIVVVTHQFTYRIFPNPEKHFASRIYEPYDLAKKLKKENAKCYSTPSRRKRNQLKFYGISPCRIYE